MIKKVLFIVMILLTSNYIGVLLNSLINIYMG